jgi:hypothetical protein
MKYSPVDVIIEDKEKSMDTKGNVSYYLLKNCCSKMVLIRCKKERAQIKKEM